MTQSEDGAAQPSEHDARRDASPPAVQIDAAAEAEQRDAAAPEAPVGAGAGTPTAGAGDDFVGRASDPAGGAPSERSATIDPGAAGSPARTAPDGRSPVIGQVVDTTEDLARRAAPTVRDIGARAAIVTAELAEASGPWLERAAAATASLSLRLAERARAFAAELERDAADGSDAAAPTAGTPEARANGAVPDEAGAVPEDAPSRAAAEDPAPAVGETTDDEASSGA